MTESKSEASEAPKPKSKKGMILAILGAVVILAAGGGASFFFMRAKAATGIEGAQKPGGKAAKGGAEGSKGQPKADSHGVLALEPFIVNLAGDDGERYMKCTMRLVLDHFEAAEKAKADDLTITRIRDAMLGILSSHSFDQVATADGKESLRQEVRKRLNGILGEGEVTEVYFTEFIVQ